MDSSRMMQPGLSSFARTLPSSTCSLNATTRSVSSPPLVMYPAAMGMRLPLAPATLRAGGRISAGMISLVHTPLPICAAIAPSDWPHFCAPSPESLITSTMCSFSVMTPFAAAALPDAAEDEAWTAGAGAGEPERAVLAAGLLIVVSFMVWQFRCRELEDASRMWSTLNPGAQKNLGDAHAREIAFPDL